MLQEGRQLQCACIALVFNTYAVLAVMQAIELYKNNQHPCGECLYPASLRWGTDSDSHVTRH